MVILPCPAAVEAETGSVMLAAQVRIPACKGDWFDGRTDCTGLGWLCGKASFMCLGNAPKPNHGAACPFFFSLSSVCRHKSLDRRLSVSVRSTYSPPLQKRLRATTSISVGSVAERLRLASQNNAKGMRREGSGGWNATTPNKDHVRRIWPRDCTHTHNMLSVSLLIASSPVSPFDCSLSLIIVVPQL